MARFYKVKMAVSRWRLMRNRLAVLLLVFLVSAVSAGCQKNRLEQTGKEESVPSMPEQPGEITGGVYLSSDSRFTVNADETQWEPDADSAGPGLRYRENESVSITFSRTEELGKEAVQNFSDSFVEGYLEGIRELYPDVRLEDSRVIGDRLARLDMSMADGTGEYPMYQILYLATDGEDGYIITAAMPENQADALKEMIYGIVESIQFRSDVPNVN